MTSLSLTTFDCPKTDLDARQNWQRWVARFRNYLIVANIPPITLANDRANQDQVTARLVIIKANLLVALGPITSAIYEQVADEADTFENVITKINEAYAPHNDATYRIMMFRQCKQLAGESIDHYVQRLREAARGCNFGNAETEIAAHIAISSNHVELRKFIELSENMTLERVLRTGRILERYSSSSNTDTHLNAISAPQQRHQTPHQSSNRPPQRQQQNQSYSQPQRYQTDNTRRFMPNRQVQFMSPQSQSRSSNSAHTSNNRQICSNCGHQLPHTSVSGQCPAVSQLCFNCNKYGHYSRCCRSRHPQHFSSTHSSYNHYRVDAINSQVQTPNNYQLSPSASAAIAQEDIEHCAALNTIKFGRRYTQGLIFGQAIEFLMDSGTTINLIDRTSFDKIKAHVGPLRTSFTNVLPYNSQTPICTLGEFTAPLSINNRVEQTHFIVTTGRSGSILGLPALESLGLIRFLDELTPQQAQARFPGVFSDKIGKIRDTQIKLHIDETIKPVQQHHRRIPFGLRDKVKAEIDRMLEMDIIEPINGPTPWVSPIVIVPKPGQIDKIRICVDAREANQAIQRERHLTPTIDDVATELNGSCYFSKLDLTAGYHQLELHPDSRYITTFSTHLGLFRYKRLNFGISSASEIFQNIIHQLISDIPGTINFSDDILVHGPTREEHNRRLHAVLERLQEFGATINPFKSELEKTELTFFGMTFSGAGISPDRKKIEAIKNTPVPKDAKDVRSFLGLTNYVSRFIKNYSSISEPLWNLTRKDVPFNWTPKHDEALQKLKQALTKDSMSYFNPLWPTEVVADASPVGLGAVLAQRDPNDPDAYKIVSYASRLLTDTETRYSQIEKEALAVVWACERFHLYVLGREFDLVTDNKAVELILRNPRSSPPLRIQRWNLRLSQYKFNIKHRPGIENPSDFLSRHPLSDLPTYSPAEEYVNFLEAQNLDPTISQKDIIDATQKDSELQLVISSIKDNKLTNTLPKTFRNVLNELTVSSNGVIFRENRLVLPKSLQFKAISLAHEGHQGIDRTKRLLRSRVWFAEMDKMVQEIVENCHACQISTKARSPHAPIHLQPLPSGPWDTVSVDLYGPILNSIHLVHLQDEFSKFPFVKVVKSTGSEHIIPVLDEIFSVFGTPRVLKSDNGPPFNGHQIAEFAQHLGFRHQKITPLWPRANGLNERFMQNITKIIVGARETKQNWQLELNNFLRSYRSTPHTSTGVSPSSLMFNYNANTSRLPLINIENNIDNNKIINSAKENHSKMIKKVEERVNDRAVERRIQVGDQVLVQQKKTHKLTPLFDPSPYEVIETKGTMITAARPDHVITRNCSLFKVVKFRQNHASHQQTPQQKPLLTTNELTLLLDAQTQPVPLMQLAVRPPPQPTLPLPHIVVAPEVSVPNPPQQNVVHDSRPSHIPININTPRPIRTVRPPDTLNISNCHTKRY